MTTPTLSQLADIGAKAAADQFASEQDDSVGMYVLAGATNYAIDAKAREAFAKAVLDAVGYKLPVDPEREAFDAWRSKNTVDSDDAFFQVWKAGRDELREKSGTAVHEKPAPETFEAHGYTWFKHTPGDPCPVTKDAMVVVFNDNKDEVEPCSGGCNHLDWSANVGTKIIGWRHA